jgi:hypothetical protein
MKKSSCFLQFCNGKVERVKHHEREKEKQCERWSTRERERVRGREGELEKRGSMRERNRKKYVDVRNLITSKHCMLDNCHAMVQE